MLTGISANPVGSKSYSTSTQGGRIKCLLYFSATLHKNIELNINVFVLFSFSCFFSTACIMRRITLKQEFNMDISTLRRRHKTAVYM